MREDYTLLTPENVELHYDVAGLGSRLVAAFLDYLVLYFSVMTLLFGGSFVVGLIGVMLHDFSSRLDEYVAYGAFAAAVLLIFFAWWGYFVLFEMLWN